MITVRTHSLSRAHPVAERVTVIADQAAKLVARKAGRLPRVEIVVTGRRNTNSLAEAAEAAVIGGRKPLKSPAVRYERTTLSPRGVLVVINVDLHHNDLETDTTVVHGLVHAAQLNRPGGRERQLVILHNNYIAELPDADAAKLNRQIRKDETEARRAERLARHLK